MTMKHYKPMEPHLDSHSTTKPAHKAIKDHKPVRCLIMRETQAAILVEVAPCNYPEGERPVKGNTEWFPLSQVSYINNLQDVMAAHDADSEDGRYTDTIHVAKWLLDKKGMGY